MIASTEHRNKSELFYIFITLVGVTQYELFKYTEMLLPGSRDKFSKFSKHMFFQMNGQKKNISITTSAVEMTFLEQTAAWMCLDLSKDRPLAFSKL